MIRMVGGTLGVAVIGAIFQAQAARRRSRIRPPSSHAFSAAMWVATAVTALGAALAIATAARPRRARRRRPRPRSAATALGESAAGEIAAERRRRARDRLTLEPAHREIERRPRAGLGQVELRQRLDLDLAERGDRLAVRALDRARGASARA